MIAIDLSKQQALDADPRASQQINFTGNLDNTWDAAHFSALEEAKRNYFGLFTRNYEGIVNMLHNNFIYLI